MIEVCNDFKPTNTNCGCRFVYNKALALQKARFEAGEKKLGYTAWLADAPVQPLQQALKDLERAYANCFAKRADFPHFKKKGRNDSFRYPDPQQIKLEPHNRRIFLPKLGWIRYRNRREALGTGKNVTVSQSCGNKLAREGGWPMVVPPQNTSRTCPCCGHVSAANRQTQARFECVECGFVENADLVGAINVLRVGHARIACEVSGAVLPPAAGTRRRNLRHSCRGGCQRHTQLRLHVLPQRPGEGSVATHSGR